MEIIYESAESPVAVRKADTMDSMSISFAGGSVRMKKRKKHHHKSVKPVSNNGASPPPPYEQLEYSDEEKDEKRFKRRKRDGDQNSVKTGMTYLLEVRDRLRANKGHSIKSMSEGNRVVGKYVAWASQSIEGES